MSRTARILLSVAWFTVISLVASTPPAQLAADAPQPGPCYYYNGAWFCP